MSERRDDILRWLEMAQDALKAEIDKTTDGEARFSLEWADGLIDATFESLKLGGIR